MLFIDTKTTMSDIKSMSRERGSALITVLVYSALILVICAGAIGTTVSNTRNLSRSNGYKQSMALAEAGAEDALSLLNTSGNAWTGWTSNGNNRSISNQTLKDSNGDSVGTYSVTVYNATGNTPRIESVGYAKSTSGDVRRKIVVPVKGNSSPSFFGPYGIYSNSDILVNSKASTDAYDSSVGPYGGTNSGLSHSLAAVGNADLKSNSNIGNLQLGGTAHTDNGNAKAASISQNNMPTAPPAFPDADLAAAKLSNNNSQIKVYEVKNNGTSTLVKTGIDTNGVYNFNNLNVNGTMRIDFPAGTYYLNSIQINSNAEITVQGAVKIFMDPGANQTAIQMNSNTTMNAQGSNPLPSNLQLFIKSGNVNFNSNFSIYAAVFAPNSKFNYFNSNTYLYGALVAGDIKMNSNSHIYIDKSLSNPAGSNGFLAICWSELPIA